MKKKSTLLVGLLTMVCVVCAAFGLAACTEDLATSIKVGNNKIGTVDAEGVTLEVEGELFKEYVVTAKVGGEVCDSVLIQIPGVAAYAYGSLGTFEFKNGKDDNNQNYKIKFSSETAVKNVTVTMAEKTYPAGSIKNPNTVTVGADVSYSVGMDYVWYTVTVDTAKDYKITFTDDEVYVIYGSDLDGDGEGLLDGGMVAENGMLLDLEAGTKYYVGIASDKLDGMDYATVSGTFKVEAYDYGTPNQDPVLKLDTPVVIESLSEATNVQISLSAAEADNKTFKITACVGDATEASADVVLSARLSMMAMAATSGNPLEGYSYSVGNSGLTVDLANGVTGPVANVKIVITEEEAGDDEGNYPAFSLTGPNIITGAGEWTPVVYTLTIVEGGDYTFTGIDVINIGVSTDVAGANAIYAGGDNDDVFTLEAGTYYVSFYANGTVSISKN